MSVDMSQFHGVFFEESQEHLDEMEHLLMDLDLDEPDPEDLNSIFRAAHSIKGGSGIFGFDALTGLTHVMENLLDKARKGQTTLTTPIVDTLLSTVDLLKSILDCYRDEEDIDWNSIKQGSKALESILPDEQTSDHSHEKEDGFGFFDGPPNVPEAEDESFGFFDDEPQSTETKRVAEEDDGFGFFDDEPKSTEAKQNIEDDDGFGFFEPLDNAPSNDQSAAKNAEKGALHSEEDDGFGFFEPLDESSQATTEHPQPPSSQPNLTEKSESEKPVSTAKPNRADKPKKAAVKSKSAANKDSGSIRVDTVKIDSLVNLVGELVITQSMIKMVGSEIHGTIAEKLEGAVGELSRNIREIQEAVMSMRMLPMSFAFNRFPRVVRDLASKLDKQVELVIEGGTTEIDKGLIEKLVDPLTHLVRNSIDHGIEVPAKRIEAGKPAQGTVILRAEQRGGSIIISIIDDGAGLNRDRILGKAIENGLDVHDGLTDSQVWNLIFAAGFSTAEQVTDVSGRGVGMDVVRRNIESIGGHVEIKSQTGQGSTINIRLPLTLAILDGMCVATGEQVFVIPLTNIIESIQPDASQVKHLANDKLLWVRETYWPVISLYEYMGIEEAEVDPTKAIVVLIETSSKRFGLLVDRLVGQQQVVIKSLEQHYKRVSGVAGATIMGDGSVAMILDVESLATNVQQPQIESEVNLA
ncbi:MAG: chemotaxis protein CheA [Aliiglaciecola sp.]